MTAKTNAYTKIHSQTNKPPLKSAFRQLRPRSSMCCCVQFALGMKHYPLAKSRHLYAHEHQAPLVVGLGSPPFATYDFCISIGSVKLQDVQNVLNVTGARIRRKLHFDDSGTSYAAYPSFEEIHHVLPVIGLGIRALKGEPWYAVLDSRVACIVCIRESRNLIDFSLVEACMPGQKQLRYFCQLLGFVWLAILCYSYANTTNFIDNQLGCIQFISAYRSVEEVLASKFKILSIGVIQYAFCTNKFAFVGCFGSCVHKKTVISLEHLGKRLEYVSYMQLYMLGRLCLPVFLLGNISISSIQALSDMKRLPARTGSGS